MADQKVDEGQQRLLENLKLEPESQNQVLRIVLNHGKEQGMPREVQTLLRQCCEDDYEEWMKRSLI